MNSSIIPAALLSAVIGLLLVYLNRPDATSAALLFGISVIFSCSVIMVQKRLAALHGQKLKSNAIIWMLGQILYCRSQSSSLFAILSIIGRSPQIRGISVDFKAIRSRLRLGESFSTVLHSILAANEYTKHLAFTGNIDAYAQSKRILHEHEQARKGREAVSIGALQRSATINMFLSTMVPSFIIFAFIGQTIISQSTYGLLGLSLLLLIVVPFAYSAGAALMARRLIAETV
ncbi:MAG: hypothetical protein KGH49_03985 [Candidatus Micrarchaeota archaeon]|nr:hypothetical protein [Candidatus Micrarchaeota archaeon]